MNKIILLLKFPQVLFSMKMLTSYFQVLEPYFSLTCVFNLRYMPLNRQFLILVWASVGTGVQLIERLSLIRSGTYARILCMPHLYNIFWKQAFRFSRKQNNCSENVCHKLWGVLGKVACCSRENPLVWENDSVLHWE